MVPRCRALVGRFGHRLGMVAFEKIESISAPMSTKRPQDTKHSWTTGRQRPAEAAFAQAVLMDLTDKLKAEHCLVQPDVVDALMRQPHTDHLPFRGRQPSRERCCNRLRLGTCWDGLRGRGGRHVPRQLRSFTAWNNGWTGRNDGVDIGRVGDFPQRPRWAGPNGRMDEVHRRRGVLRSTRSHLGGVELRRWRPPS